MRAFKPSPAMVVALLALIIALGGTAFAAGYMITSSKQIKDGAVTSADVKNSSLTGRDIKDGALTARDFTGSVQGPAGVQGLQGPQGSAGVAGPKGETGAPGGTTSTTVTHLHGGPVTVPQGQSGVAVPLSNGGAFTQHAGEVDQIVVYLDANVPASYAACVGGPAGAGYVDVSGSPDAWSPVFFNYGQSTRGASSVGQVPPAVDTARTLTATATNSCTLAGADITINSVDVYVIAAR